MHLPNDLRLHMRPAEPTKGFRPKLQFAWAGISRTSDLPIEHFIIGKTWHLENEEPCTFIVDRGQLAEELESGRFLCQAGP